jgi:hypothetical protein
MKHKLQLRINNKYYKKPNNHHPQVSIKMEMSMLIKMNIKIWK